MPIQPSRFLCGFFLYLCLPISSWCADGIRNVYLVEKIDFSNITDTGNKPIEGLGQQEWINAYHQNQKQYGFIQGGQSVYFGEGCWRYDISNKKMKCDFPKSLKNVYISYSGEIISGCMSEDGKRASFYLNTLTQRDRHDAKTCYNNILDPTHTYSAEDGEIGFPATRIYISIYIRNIFSEKTKTINEKRGFYSFLGFSGDGKYILTENGAVDIFTKKKIVAQPPFNYDVTLNYGTESHTTDRYGDDETTTSYIQNIKTKRYLWRNRPDYGKALGYSWNGDYLFTSKGLLISAKTGDVVAADLHGNKGVRFSPDGRSFVSSDEEAFYIYTLPEQTGPLFGKYPGPKYKFDF